MADGYVGVAPDWAITTVNHTTVRLQGAPASSIIGCNFWELWPSTLGTDIERFYRNVMTIRVAAHFEYHVVVPEVRDNWLEIDAYPNKKTGGLSIFWRDITPRKRGEAAERAHRAALEQQRHDAEAAQRAAEAANAAKSQFLAAMSHELRTPLNAICGYVDLLELGVHGPVTEDQTLALRRIKTNQQHLLGLINDVLNFTKLSASQVTYQMSDVSVDVALRAAEVMVLPQMHAAQLNYVYGGYDPDVTVYADEEKLRQIVLNVLSNSIKFTPRGGSIRLSCAHDADIFRICVTDTGVGIPPDKLDTIFEPFVQVERRLNQPIDGIGLGLAISRQLARGMGGDLTATSTLGVGSVFSITLPVRRQELQSAKSSAAPRKR